MSKKGLDTIVSKSIIWKKQFNNSIERKYFSPLDTCFEYDADYQGYQIDMNTKASDPDYGRGAGKRDSPGKCQKLCQQRKNCVSFTWKTNHECWLKNKTGEWKSETDSISGLKFCEGWYCNFSLNK